MPLPLPSLIALLAGGCGLAAAALVYRAIRRQPAGTAAMQELAGLIEVGAMAFLRREYTVLLPFVVLVAALLGWAVGWPTALAYAFGGSCSILAGLFGMKAATKANVRTSEAARTLGQARALRIAFDGGSVMGLAVAALGLVGIGAVSALTVPGGGLPPGDQLEAGYRRFAEIISGFAMGASSIALFARVGGGIFTKAADVGADLVGKVEAGIPEDDPRNPATIADNVGDNVGDVAGMGADIFESYVGAVIAAVALAATSPAIGAEYRHNAVALPILFIVLGLGASLLAIAGMRLLDRGQPATALRTVTLLAAGLFLAGAWVSITTSIRRLHDCGRTGWLVLLTPMPFLGFALGLYLLFCPGNPGPNRYGPPPGAPDPDAMRAQLAKLEAVTAPYRQAEDGSGTDGDGDPSAPAPSAWPDDAAPAPVPLAFDPMALYRENPGLAPPTEAHR